MTARHRRDGAFPAGPSGTAVRRSSRSPDRAWATRLVACALGLYWLLPATRAEGQVYVTDYIGGTVGQYTLSGELVNRALIKNLSAPSGIAISGSDIYVANSGNRTVGKYDLSGAARDAAFITGISQPYGVAVADGYVYVTDYLKGTLGKYTTSGGVVNAALVSGLFQPSGVAVSDGFLYITNGTSIGKFTTGGAVVNRSFISRFVMSGVAVSGSTVYALDNIGRAVGTYTTAGEPINTSLITNLVNPYSIAVAGSHVYVGNHATPAFFTDYTTSGQTVSDPFIVQPGISYGIAVLPEPAVAPAAGLLLLAALRRFRTRRGAVRSTPTPRHCPTLGQPAPKRAV